MQKILSIWSNLRKLIPRKTDSKRFVPPPFFYSELPIPEAFGYSKKVKIDVLQLGDNKWTLRMGFTPQGEPKPLSVTLQIGNFKDTKLVESNMAEFETNISPEQWHDAEITIDPVEELKATNIANQPLDT